jgi:hypothetical protein
VAIGKNFLKNIRELIGRYPPTPESARAGTEAKAGLVD